MRNFLMLTITLLVAACAMGRPEQHAALVQLDAPAGYALGAPQMVVHDGVLSLQGALCAGAAPTTAPPREVLVVAMTTNGVLQHRSAPLHGGPLVGAHQRCAFYSQELGPAESIREVSVCAGKLCD